MKAGLLRHRVTFQRRINGVDEVGQPFDEWEHVCTVWAAITDQTGKEFNASQTEYAVTNSTISIRYRNDITADMRALCRGVYYDINAVLEDSRKTQLDLPSQKGVRYENGS